MHLQITRDALSNEDLPDEIFARELALDKELVQLIQTACKNDKLPRALELTSMLHHTSSFDMAVKVAGFYRLVGLQEKMEALKEDRITHGRPQRREWARDYDPVLPSRLPPPDVPRGGASKAFQNFGSPAAVHRPGLARATPSLPPIPNDHAVAAVNGEGKRKWVDDGDGDGDGIVTHVDAAQPDNARWRAVDDEFTTRAGVGAGLSSKPSTHVPRLFLFLFLFGSPLDLPPPPTLIEANPFAKKPNGTTADGSRNPFARDNPNSKSLHKSESFFDKAEAAETGKWRGPSVNALSFLTRAINTERSGCACLRQEARQVLRTDGDRREIIQSRQRCSGCLPYPRRTGQRSALVKRVEWSRPRTQALPKPKPWNRRTSRWRNSKMWRLPKRRKRRLRRPWTHSKSLKQLK
jgi:chromosome transmission fidelity protein 4